MDAGDQVIQAELFGAVCQFIDQVQALAIKSGAETKVKEAL